MPMFHCPTELGDLTLIHQTQGVFMEMMNHHGCKTFTRGEFLLIGFFSCTPLHFYSF